MSLLTDRIMQRAGKLALQRVRPRIPSKELRRSCRFVMTPSGPAGRATYGKLTIPHYWAVIVHDGRRAVVAKGRKILIWYKDPTKDPRFPGRNSPKRYADRDRFEPAGTIPLKKFRRDYKAGKVIVSKRSGPVKGRPFFGNESGEGMAGFRLQVSQVAIEEVRKELSDLIKKPKGLRALDERNAIAAL